MNTATSPNDIHDIELLRKRLISVELQLVGKSRIIEKQEEIIAQLAQRHWGRSSEKHPGQSELSLFNEVELAAMQAPLDDQTDDADADTHKSPDTADIDQSPEAIPAKPGKPRKRRVLPDHLERVRVTHELDGEHLQSPCGGTWARIGEELTQQIGVIPARQFVIQHIKLKYACSCRECGVKTAAMPLQPLPGSQASALMLAFTMVAKFLDGLPLYRQEKMWEREGLELSRSKLARWLIDSAVQLQPLYNLMQEVFFAYDIAMSDDTGIQVLKEDGRAASSRSALWIRRGGSAQTPVVLLDYNVSKGAAVASTLLEQFKGYLVVDAAPSFNAIVGKNELKTVYCNDHYLDSFFIPSDSRSSRVGIDVSVCSACGGSMKIIAESRTTALKIRWSLAKYCRIWKPQAVPYRQAQQRVLLEHARRRQGVASLHKSHGRPARGARLGMVNGCCTRKRRVGQSLHARD